MRNYNLYFRGFPNFSFLCYEIENDYLINARQQTRKLFFFQTRKLKVDSHSLENILFIYFFNFLFIYDSHTEREREREAETQAEEEAGSMHREPDVGFDPGSPGSRPGPKTGAKPLRHQGSP